MVWKQQGYGARQRLTETQTSVWFRRSATMSWCVDSSLVKAGGLLKLGHSWDLSEEGTEAASVFPQMAVVWHLLIWMKITFSPIFPPLCWWLNILSCPLFSFWSCQINLIIYIRWKRDTLGKSRDCNVWLVSFRSAVRDILGQASWLTFFLLFFMLN